MSLNTYMKRMKYVDDLIRRKATGNPASFAKKLNLSRSQALAFLEEMKEHGFPIAYSRKIESYFYTADIELNLRLFNTIINFKGEGQKTLSKEKLRKITGGQTFFNFQVPSDYIRRNDLNFWN